MLVVVKVMLYRAQFSLGAVPHPWAQAQGLVYLLSDGKIIV